MLIFVTGGARSGKSHFAEELVQSFQTGDNEVKYIATSKIVDEEMEQRVARHRKDRSEKGYNWTVIEQSRHLEQLVPMIQSEDIILLDCLTVFVANELFYEEFIWKCADYREQLFQQMIQSIEKMSERSQAMVIVSNDIFTSGVPDDEGAYVYMQMLGKLHQMIVDMAKVAINVQHGQPIVEKRKINL